MNNPSDIYEEAKIIAHLLSEVGARNSADLVIEKIESGSTATEILMGVRWAVQECLKTRRKKMGDLDKRMLALVARIDGALK